MQIKRIEVSNFKNFDHLEVELGRLNIVIGANAAGKSNFLQTLKFLGDIEKLGLENAISNQGGIEYLRNINTGPSTELRFQITFSTPNLQRNFRGNSEKSSLKLLTNEIRYAFAVGFGKRHRSYRILDDRLEIAGHFLRSEKEGKETRREQLGSGTLRYLKRGKDLDLEVAKPDDVDLREEDIIGIPLAEFAYYVVGRADSPKKLLLETGLFPLLTPGRLTEFFKDLSVVYDFHPKLAKCASAFTGTAQLEEDGGNLAVTLRNILQRRKSKAKLADLMNDLLPFVEGLRVERFAGKSLLLELKEKYSNGQFLPASFLSDGTINVTALIVALYFEERRVVLVEEPEKNIHPSLISRVVAMMQDASRRKQIIATSHNPEVLRHVNREDILLVSREDGGFSTVSRPIESEKIRHFLEKEMQLEELYVENLLETLS